MAPLRSLALILAWVGIVAAGECEGTIDADDGP